MSYLCKKIPNFAIEIMTHRPTTIGIIPARIGSTRFPRKPLALLGGMPMVEHVYRNAAHALDRVVVATDSPEIADTVRGFGGEAVLTPESCPNGTARALIAYQSLGADHDVIVNIQGDEPFLTPADISAVAVEAAISPLDIVTLIRRLDADEWPLLNDPSAVKAVLDCRGFALYFSRSPIPAVQGEEISRWPAVAPCYVHHGIYAFHPSSVITSPILSSPSPLSKVESLEQLSWLEAGIKIKCIETHTRAIGIDTPRDLETANRRYEHS